jgi:serine protease Do
VNRKSLIIITAIMALPLLVGFWTGYGIGHRQPAPLQIRQVSNTEGESPAPQSVSDGQSRASDNPSDQISNSRQNAITRSVALASPAVVGINVTEVREYTYTDPWSQFFGNDPWFRQYFGGNRTFKQELKGLGSGFIISPDGYILTNDHVAGNAKEITVTLTSREKYKAELIGTDAATDIALLKIEGKDFPFLKLGRSDDILIGEWAIAMGNPFGLFEISDKPTVTVGVVSATGMNLNSEGGRYYRDMIQTDAAINSGNSGGPLLNSNGEVIGVNSVIFSPNQGNIGLGFAIPINRVKSVADELRRNGKIERNLWTGLEVQTVDMRVARYFGLNRAQGVIVSDVHRSSPAELAGFKPGDIIVSVNGEQIANDDNFIAILIDLKPGDVLHTKVLRQKKEVALDLKVERRPQ